MLARGDIEREECGCVHVSETFGVPAVLRTGVLMDEAEGAGGKANGVME